MDAIQPKNQTSRMTMTEAAVRFQRRLATARAAPIPVSVLRTRPMKPKLKAASSMLMEKG
jgi:hypothetical protein